MKTFEETTADREAATQVANTKYLAGICDDDSVCSSNYNLSDLAHCASVLSSEMAANKVADESYQLMISNVQFLREILKDAEKLKDSLENILDFIAESNRGE